MESTQKYLRYKKTNKLPWQNGREKYAYVSCLLWYGPTVFIHKTTSSLSSYYKPKEG